MFYRRKILLALIEAFGGALSEIDCQKLLLLFCLRRGENYYDFFPYNRGNFSLILAQDKNRLADLGFLVSSDTFQLNTNQPCLSRIKPKDLATLRERKKYALKEVFTSMNSLIELAKEDEKKSLATLKPREIVDFVIEPDEREWKPKWRDQFRQYNLFDLDSSGQGKQRTVIRKLPYKYSYKFWSDKDKQPRKLMIEDWEIGALYWNCFEDTGNEDEANRLVKKRYFDDFCFNKDLYFFLGTTLQYHMISPNPFVIIGVFYPPKPKEEDAKKTVSPDGPKIDDVKQQQFDF